MDSPASGDFATDDLLRPRGVVDAASYRFDVQDTRSGYPVMCMRDSNRTTVREFLKSARDVIDRVTPEEVHAAHAAGARIVDTRDHTDRQAEGVIPGSIPIPPSVLPWRVDPEAKFTNDRVNDLDGHLVIVRNDGYSSNWVAAALVGLGFTSISDLKCGLREWAAFGLPIESVD